MALLLESFGESEILLEAAVGVLVDVIWAEPGVTLRGETKRRPPASSSITCMYIWPGTRFVCLEKMACGVPKTRTADRKLSTPKLLFTGIVFQQLRDYVHEGMWPAL